MSASVVLDHVWAGYGPLPVLRDVSMTCAAGQATVVLGANGAGKTTLLRAISGVIQRSGSLTVVGKESSSLAAEKVARLGVGHVPQGRGTFANQSVEDNLRIGAYIRRDTKSIDKDMDMWFDHFPILRSRRRQKAGTLSGGEQQMLALARAMMRRPSVLLLDEPSLGLAPKLVEQVFDVIREILADGETTIVLVEQNAHRALELASHVYVLEVGAVVLHGSPEIVRSSSELRSAYLGTGS